MCRRAFTAAGFKHECKDSVKWCTKGYSAPHTTEKDPEILYRKVFRGFLWLARFAKGSTGN